MIQENMYTTIQTPIGTKEKLKGYFQLLKTRLTMTVVFSGMFGYLLAVDGSVYYAKLIALAVGSFMVTGAANIINQMIEKDLDKMMKRTANRPLPTGIITIPEAIVYTIGLAAIGSAILYFMVNPLTAALSLFSLILYAFVYTPLKQITPIAVLVGAFPGALPPLIGWAAMTGQVTVEAFILFGIQFLWQFPHFWAIAWVGDEDYQKAGFKMLPYRDGKNVNTAFQIMIYTLFLIPLGVLPAQFGMTGYISAIIVTLAGIGFFVQTLRLMSDLSNKAALRIMFTSFIYMPVMQIAFLIDKV